MDRVDPSKIRYIKLGAGGRWEAAALDRGRLQWGVPNDPHDMAVEGDWTGLTMFYRDAGLIASTATGYTNEARAFYDRDGSAIWVTFARGRMWWGRAEPEVHWIGGDGGAEGTRYRIMTGGWHDTDILGGSLNLDRLSTNLTQLAAYRRTICGLTVEQQALCLRYINVEADAEHQAVADARAALRASLTALIRRLTWSDFELLVDLAMSRSGWTRVSDLGKTGKDVDLIVEQQLTGQRMAVQVKSAADQRVVDDYARRLGEHASTDRCMLICHSPKGQLKAPPAAGSGRQLDLMLGDQITDLAMRAGLVDWIVQRAR